MSSFPLFPTEAARRPAAAVASNSASVFDRLAALPKLAEVTPAARLTVRPTPEMVPSGIREIDALTGGLPRGSLTEVFGPASSGRTCLLLAALSAATQRQEACALVDVSDALDPLSAAAAAVNFEKLLWIRCGFSPKSRGKQNPDRIGKAQTEDKKRKASETPVEQALRVTDLLLQSGGFGLVIIDLGDVPLRTARRIPLASWFRFQRAIEHTPTILLVITPVSCAQTCATLLFQLSAISSQRSAKRKSSLAHTHLLENLHIEAELLRSRLERKPVRSTVFFRTQSVHVG